MKIELRALAVVLTLIASVAVAKDPVPAEVFIDDGVLYGVTSDSLMRLDLQSGSGSVTWKDGQAIALDQMPNRSLEQGAWSKIGLIHLSNTAAQRSTGCSAQASAVQAAVSLVESACSGGPSDSCDAAMVALDAANAAYIGCLRQFLQER